MIEHVSIKNFAVIKNTEVDFEPGLNIITGETGAGKSIVIEAISLALGARADNSFVRYGEEKATIELLGSVNDEEVVITREISKNGKNVCKLNGELVTLQILNEKTHLLADIHGQYDNQSLLNPDYHIELLDKYKKEKTQSLKNEILLNYQCYVEIKQKLISLLNHERENARKKDFYKFEIDDIDSVNPQINEDLELEDRISVLNNSEKIYENLENSYSILNEEDNSILSSFSISCKLLNEISSYSKELNDIASESNDLYYRLQELSNSLRNIKDTISYSPKELDDAILRLNKIDDLKKKYGSSISEILEYKDKIEKELLLIENFDDEKKNLQVELVTQNKILLDNCAKLTVMRKEIAKELEEKISKELQELNFSDAKIEIRIDKLEQPTANGIDKVEIYISTNKGEPLKPLSKVVSGGEMSRIMLAFKNIISTYDQIPTLIFDEIDNGISGETASIVGTKLKEIAKKHQIICITHLPQIAAKGSSNYMIKKESDDEKTYTQIAKLNTTEKVKEIARLLGGVTITDTTLKSALELIANE